MTGARSKDIVTPPRAGLDFAAVRVGKKFMIVSSDPVTGVRQDIGRYAVNVNANDVATSGNRPKFLESVVLLPPSSKESYLMEIARQIHETAMGLGISVVGGHTEVTPGLRSPIVVATAFSFVKRYVSSMDAKAGGTLMMTKTAGLEGTAILTRSEKLLSQISVVDEAVRAYQTGHVLAMHDCTEGGVLGAAYEMSLASGIGFELVAASVPVSEETQRVSARLSIDPLRLIGSGSLLLCVKGGRENEVTAALKGICEVTAVGKFTRRDRTVILPNGEKVGVKAAPEDELWRVLGDLGRSGKALGSLSL